jgi:hypothetical protein
VKHAMKALRSLIAFAVAAGTVCACGRSAGPAVAAGGASPAASAASASPQGVRGALLSYSQCMRAHGVPNFPDLASGGTQITGQALQNEGVDTSSAAYQSAAQVCRSLLTGASGGASRVQAGVLVMFAQCVRQHGIPNFPDPVTKNGFISLSLKGTGLTEQSPVFQSALNACLKDLRGGSATGGA